MKRLTIPVFLCLVSGLAQGDTFELTDPASEIYEDFKKQKEAVTEEVPVPQPAEPAAAQPQAASSTSEPLPTGGVGATPCPEIISYRQDAPKWYEVRMSWALGYVSAASAAATQPEALDSWLDFYCRENPDANLARAVDAFVRFRSSGG